MIALLSLTSPKCANADPKEGGFLRQTSKEVTESSWQPALNEHEWADIEKVVRVLRAAVNASAGNSDRMSKIKELVEPIYTAMPKTHGGLSKETARYAMHRYFTEHRGWTIKGLQPVGSAWQQVMDVEEDTADINKYMLPAYLQDKALEEMERSNFDLNGLAVMIFTYEHLDYYALLSTLYSILTTLDVQVAGDKAEDDIREILDAYLMIYAYGVDIDTANRDDIRNNKTKLQHNQPDWQSLSAFMWNIRKLSFTKPDLNFEEIVQVVKTFGDKYVKWQEEDCTRAHDYLVGLPSFNFSSTLLQDVSVSTAEGRRDLLTEDVGFLTKLGAVAGDTSDTSPRLVIPNYLNSQRMCLATAHFHSVCCMNKCDALYTQLEQGVRAPAAKAEDLYSLVASLPDQKPGLNKGSFEALQDIADKEGLVQLHSNSFAAWMHQRFPLECPQPHDESHFTDPKTPDEWMDTCEDEDEPLALFSRFMAELCTVWSISMGSWLEKFDGTQKIFEAKPEIKLNDVIRKPKKQPTKARSSPVPWYFLTLIASALFFVRSVYKTIKGKTGCLTKILDEAIDGDLKTRV
jgi:hypothetical protein